MQKMTTFDVVHTNNSSSLLLLQHSVHSEKFPRKSELGLGLDTMRLGLLVAVHGLKIGIDGLLHD